MIHLLGVKRTEDDVALLGTFLQKCLTDISIDVHVPGTDIGRDTLFLQVVTRHENTAVELHHATTVTIYIMQGQHDTHTDSPCLDVGGVFLLDRDSLSRLGCRIRNEDIIALAEFIVRIKHLRIGLTQFLLCQAVFLGDSVDGFLLLYLVHLLPGLALLSTGFHPAQKQEKQ